MTDATSALEVPPRVLEFLRENTALTLATASPSGVPRATTLRYVNDGLTLYFWTRSQAWAAKQIEQNPLVSFTIAHETAALQGTGQARAVLGGDEVERALQLFGEKYPTALGTSTTMNTSFFRVVPSDVKLVDEMYGGGRGETQLGGGAEYKVEQVYNVLSGLPPGDVGAIVGRLSQSRVEAGSVIARQGAPADKFVIVVEGEVDVTRAGDGEPEEVMTLRPGDFFGEVAVLRDTPRSATLTAVADTTILTMERDEFTTVVSQSLGAPADFDRILRERLSGGEGQ
jgi:uncharacterized pyridoxamine 5'-phosphate oxidase family protein